LSRKACASVLGCSERTVRAWDAGARRVPWSAVKLLRLVRLGDLGALRPEWRGWSINRNGLVSPGGFAYSRGDLGWWSLTCRQVECWRQAQERQRQRGGGAAVPEPPSVPVRVVSPVGEPPAVCVRESGASLPAALGVGVVFGGGLAPVPGSAAQRRDPARGLSITQQS